MAEINIEKEAQNIAKKVMQDLRKKVMQDLRDNGVFIGRWIPVSERLPEVNQYVGDVCKYYLIQDRYGDMHVAHYQEHGWESIESRLFIDAVAWMPLPEPYKAKSEE